MLLWFHNSKHDMIYKIKHVNKYHNGSTTWLSKNQILTRAYILNHGEESEIFIKHWARNIS
jgi:hypothetical protein